MRRLLTRWGHLRDEAGAVAGAEVLPLAVLVLVVGTLLVANAWAVIDTKMAVTGAAREAVRSFVEADTAEVGRARSIAAANDAMRAAGRSGQVVDVRVTGRLRRCEPVTATVRASIPAIVLPWVGGLGEMSASSTAGEIVDPLRSGVSGEARCVAG